MKRKINEAINALQVEREFTKDEILELYLNQIFLGGSAHGVEAASWQYYGKSCRELTLAEGATLAGLTRSPNVNRPDRQPENARQRRNIVLRQMLDNEFITHEEYEAAQAEALEDSVLTPEKRATMMARREGLWAPNRFKAPYFKEEVQRLIIQNGWSDNEELFEGGLDIKTTIDMRLQRAAEEAMDAALGEFDAKRLESLQKSGRENEFVPVAGALVCLDNRRGMEGYVRAMVGGRDFEKSKFNTATQAKRQPGSSVKPFVWAVALDNGMTASDIVVDEPYVRMDGAGNRWAPQNFSGDFAGPVTLRVALQNSINIVSVKLVERFGMPLVRQCLRDAGIETPVDNVVGLTIGLGTPVVTVLEQCTAYSTFAKGGVRAAPAFVTEIKDRDGFLRHRNQIRLIPGAIKEDVAYAMTYLMEGVATWGTGARSSRLNRPRAGKTGTSNDSRDAWFCAYTPDYTCVVWVGYLDNRPLGRGRDYTGGRLACPIWTDFMIKAQEGLPVKEFMPPPGVEFHQVDKSSGLAGGSLREVFIRGTKPPSRAPEPEEELLEVVSPEEAMEAGELEAL